MPPKFRRSTKGASSKEKELVLFRDHKFFCVTAGKLVKAPGRPSIDSHLFKVVAEKIPKEALGSIKKDLKDLGIETNGVYIAHDSMSYPRYVGRGQIFTRLASHFKSHELELAYFSFYIVESKKHEREIETLLIRAAGPLLRFNDRKKKIDLQEIGNIRDYEPGTRFYERQNKRRRKKL
jgi:hypothetical protein